jgi:flagellar FliL protein
MLCNKSFGGLRKIISLLIILILFIGANACTKVTNASESSRKADEVSSFVLEPFILNIANNGEPRFLKISIALELANATLVEMAKVKKAPLRDAIIALVSSKSADDLLSQEGRMQFKDEILLQANQIFKEGASRQPGAGAVKNIYFTELIMQ